MEFLTALSYVMAVLETAALIAAMIFLTRGLHEKKNQRAKQGKKGGKNSEITQKAITACYQKAGLTFFVYLVLNVVRNYSGLFG